MGSPLRNMALRAAMPDEHRVHAMPVKTDRLLPQGHGDSRHPPLRRSSSSGRRQGRHEGEAPVTSGPASTRTRWRSAQATIHRRGNAPVEPASPCMPPCPVAESDLLRSTARWAFGSSPARSAAATTVEISYGGPSQWPCRLANSLIRREPLFLAQNVLHQRCESRLLATQVGNGGLLC